MKLSAGKPDVVVNTRRSYGRCRDGLKALLAPWAFFLRRPLVCSHRAPSVFRRWTAVTLGTLGSACSRPRLPNPVAFFLVIFIRALRRRPARPNWSSVLKPGLDAPTGLRPLFPDILRAAIPHLLAVCHRFGKCTGLCAEVGWRAREARLRHRLRQDHVCIEAEKKAKRMRMSTNHLKCQEDEDPDQDGNVASVHKAVGAGLRHEP